MEGTLVWITGLAGSGKTTIGKRVYDVLKAKDKNTVFLDGDAYREITGQTSGHSRESRLAIGLQIARMCRFLTGQGINVICSTISLFDEVHNFNRVNNRSYFEIFIETEMDELMKRDQKGLYSKALSGEIKDVIGVDMPFDRPKNCNLIVKNNLKSEIENNVWQILNLIKK